MSAALEAGVGHEPERRSWRPHVTVARVARRGRAPRRRRAAAVPSSFALERSRCTLAPRSGAALERSRGSPDALRSRRRRSARALRAALCADAPRSSCAVISRVSCAVARLVAPSCEPLRPVRSVRVPSDPARTHGCAPEREKGRTSHARHRREGRQGPRRRPAGRAHADRAPVRQGQRSCAWATRARRCKVNAIPTGALSLDLALGIGGMPARAHRRGLRPGVLGQDDARLPRPRRGPEARRRVRVHRRRARDGPALRPARSASTSTSCSSRSPTTASRRSRSPTCSCAPARSTSSRSTRSRR